MQEDFDQEDTQETPSGMTVESALHEIGWGKYSTMLAVWGSVGSAMCGMHTMSGFFTTLPHEVVCREGTVCQGSAPSLEDFCDDIPHFNETWMLGGHAKSTVTEWGACHDTWIGPLAGALFFMGWFVGGVLSGTLSTKHGRKTISFILILGASLSLALSSVSSNLGMYFSSRFLDGCCIGGLSLVSYILATESVSIAYQPKLGTLILGTFGVGETLLVPIAYWVPEWKAFSLLISLLCLPCVFWYWYIEESPRWNAAAGHKGAAEVSLQKIAATNGVSLSDGTLKEVPTVQGSADESMMSLFRHSVIRTRTLVMCFTWFACSLSYYGLNFAAGSLGGNLYVNAAVIAVIELPAYVLQYFTTESPKIGRKGSMLWGLGVGGSCCLLYFVFYSMGLDDLGRVFAFVGKFGVTVAFSLAYIWGSELFPTSVRSTAMGLSTASARIGGLSAPFIASKGASSLIVFGVCLVTSAFLCSLLPETINTTLPESLADLQKPKPAVQSAYSADSAEEIPEGVATLEESLN
eukprot:TRINITY_DN37025_c0_g1_i1.p1 TRINITY_DN37025_c0_g1~~TRINITY_DN37025_c0_g1_i1.p1  ORF type:complete len:521 (+),score=72.58 TRINITY_DN37025_c0_g1_i1:65-1627(+)